jgi:hypothetical protein
LLVAVYFLPSFLVVAIGKGQLQKSPSEGETLLKTKKKFESHVDKKILPSLDYYIEKKWLQPDCGTLGSFSSICFSFIFFFFPRFSAI